MPGLGSAVTSSRTTVTRGCDVTRSCTPSENTSRSTVSALPPGTRASSAALRTTEPSRRISALSRPCAFDVSVLLKVFEQTSSARRSVLCAGVPRTPRISWMHDVVAALGELPRGFASGESAADDVDRC